MPKLLKIASENHSSYVNLDTIHVIEHNNKKKIYTLKVAVPDGNYVDTEAFYSFSKAHDPSCYDQIKAYVRKHKHSTPTSPKKNILPLVSLDT